MNIKNKNVLIISSFSILAFINFLMNSNIRNEFLIMLNTNILKLTGGLSRGFTIQYFMFTFIFICLVCSLAQYFTAGEKAFSNTFFLTQLSIVLLIGLSLKTFMSICSPFLLRSLYLYKGGYLFYSLTLNSINFLINFIIITLSFYILLKKQQNISIASYFTVPKKTIAPIAILLFLIVGAIILVSFITNESYTFLQQKINRSSSSAINNYLLQMNIYSSVFNLFINIAVFYINYFFSEKFIIQNNQIEGEQTNEI